MLPPKVATVLSWPGQPQAALSKAIFVSLLLIHGQDYLGKAAPAIALDLLVIAFTLLFLLAVQKRRSA